MKSSQLRLLLILTAFCTFSLVQAQQTNEISGKVVDETDQPMPGVNVVVKGVKIGTVTNYNGFYTLKVSNPASAIIVFSFIGMNSKEEKVGNTKIINVKLVTSSTELNEVVAVGYGNMKRKDLTGSVVSVNAEEMAKVPTSDVAQALAGRVSGLLVSQSQGAPGSDISIRVRGGISITGDNNPLYIIDGFPSEDGLSSLDPGNIESIDVLKDASSTAIYGARGANGVIVVTTKSGNTSKTTVTYDGYFGVKRLANKLTILNPREFVLMDYERRNLKLPSDVSGFIATYGPFASIDSLYSNRPGINWQDEAFGNNAYSQNHRISITGGEKKLKYNLSYSYNDDQGQMVESGQTKNMFNLKVDHEVNSKFKASATVSYTEIAVHGMGTSDGSLYFNKMSQILQYRPTIGINGKDADLITAEVDPLLVDILGNTMQNPVLSAKEEHILSEQRILQINGGFTYQIIPGLSFRNTTGISYRTTRGSSFYGAKSITAKRSSIQGFIRNTDLQNAQISNTLNYEGSKGRHKFNAMVGQEYVSIWTRYVEADAYNFPNDDIGLNDMSLGTLSAAKSNFNDNNKLLSFFARGYYNYADKYMLTATLRADGSSKFGIKWGYFPSASFAWRASEEAFIKNLNVFSDLKFRLGYGSAGNNRINSYGSLALMGSVTYPINNTTQTGYAPTQIPNLNLQWEANKTFNLGIDAGFFGQRLIISPEMYINQSSQLLLQTQLPRSSGYPSMIQNIGKSENRGIDLTIKSINIKSKDFQWTTDLNISHNENKIVALSGEQSFLVESGFGFAQNDFLVQVGQPIGQIYGYKIIGLYQPSDFSAYDATTNKYTLNPGIAYDNRKAPRPGFWKYENNPATTEVDTNGNPLITDADRQVIGNTNPILYGGFNNTFTYKNFDLSIFMNFSIGNSILNATKLYASRIGTLNKNALDIVNSSNRFITIDASGNRVYDLTQLAQMNEGKTIASYENMQLSDTYITSWGVEDGSFIRLNNVTLGYSLPKSLIKKVGVTKCRIYTTASNLFVLTKYTGFDPEVSTLNSSGLTPGVDWGAYPRSSTIVFGINLSF
jgi:TonB-linked SusC/RagA family outer membrane protein